ncbi:alpha-L-fucosidase [Clostridium oryzae]|uniref:alpha-L-fucosidase n=1 Tax=Clostridium oryzae TaxID=1450648 RepID=A0A1V4IQA6_9CLOT|nr:alpha-L-fucosidase [Clostridium oryzae]
MNDTWGYNKYDNNWKKPDDIIRFLLKINSRGGNYLLNVGPDSNGRIPEGSTQVLDQVGKYIRENSEAIFDTKRVDIYAYELEWAQFTRKDYKLYIHMLQPKIRIELLNVGNHVKRAYLVKDKTELPYKIMKACEGNSIIEVQLPEYLYDQKNYCVCLEMEEKEPIFEPIEG